MGGIIKLAIERPVAVMAVILMTVIFGVVDPMHIPYGFMKLTSLDSAVCRAVWGRF